MAKKAKAEESKASEDDVDGEDAEAAEGEDGEGADGEGKETAPPKKSKKKIIILIVLVIVLALGGAAGAYFAGLFGQIGPAAEVEVGKDGKPLDKAVFFALPEFFVNLNSGTKQATFLKTTIILEIAQEADAVQIEANLPRLLDAFNTYLRELRTSDLTGSAGIQRLREELLVRANKSLAPLKINDVLFKEVIVQ